MTRVTHFKKGKKTNGFKIINQGIYPFESYLVIDVIRAQPPDHHADEGRTDGYSLEVALGVVSWPLGP